MNGQEEEYGDRMAPFGTFSVAMTAIIAQNPTFWPCSVTMGLQAERFGQFER